MKGLLFRDYNYIPLLATLFLLLVLFLPPLWARPPALLSQPAVTQVRMLADPTPVVLPPTAAMLTIPSPAATPTGRVAKHWYFTPGQSSRRGVRPDSPWSSLVVVLNGPASLQRVADKWSIEPHIAGSWSTADNSTFVFTPKQAWSSETTYLVQFPDLLGENAFYFQTYSWVQFASGNPLYVQKNLAETVHIYFNYPVNRQAAEAALSIQPPAAFRTAWEGSILIVRPEKFWEAESSYTFTVDVSASGPEGLPLDQPVSRTLTTCSALIGYGPMGETSEYGVVSLSFDRPVDRASVEAALHLSPTVGGSFFWKGNRVDFVPTNGLAEGTYQASLDPSARGVDGSVLLKNTVHWSFRVKAGDFRMSFGYGPNVQVIDADGPRLVRYFTDRYGSGQAPWLNFTLFQIAPERLLADYNSAIKGETPISTDGLAVLLQWREVTTGTEEVALPADVPPGLYVLAIGGPQGVQDTLLVVLTHYTLILKESAIGMGSSAVHPVTGYASAIRSGQPRANMIVRLYDRSGRPYGEGVTDALGRFQAVVAGDTDPLLALGEIDGETTLCGFGPEWNSLGYSWWGWSPTPPVGQRYRVYLYTDRPIYRPGQTVFTRAIVRVVDDAAYSLPASGITVTVRLRDARDNVLNTRVLHTGEFGTLSTSFDLADGGTVGNYNLEAVVGEESTRQVLKVEEYRRPDYEVILRTDPPRPVRGQTITVTVEARYYLGRPVVGAPVSLRTYLQFYDYWAGQVDSWRELGQPLQGKTDKEGRWQTQLTLQGKDQSYSDYNYGSLDLEATVTDGSGQSVSAHSVARSAPGNSMYDYAYGTDYTLQVALDKASYRIGEVAQVTVTSPAAGLGLLTLERGQVRRIFPIQLNEGSTIFSLPVEADFAPNVFVTVQLYQLVATGQGDRWSSLTDADLLLGRAEMVVSQPERQLQVTVAPERESYAPRQEATIILQVTDITGQPVRAELSLAMVDEAVYALAQELAPNIVDSFYGRRSNLVRTYDSLQPYRYLSCNCGRGGGGFSADNPRRNFPDTAYWNPSIVTDENGRAIVTIPLPDSLTRWRLVARAVTVDTRVGEGTGALIVTQALVVRPALPRFLIYGDTLTLTATLHNYTGGTLNGEAGLVVDGLDVRGPLTYTVAVEAGETAALAWPVEAVALGPITVTTYATAAGVSDGVLHSIPVLPFAVPEVNSWSGEFIGERIERFTLPDQFIPEATQLEVRLAPSVVPTLSDGLEYLVGYPFG